MSPQDDFTLLYRIAKNYYIHDYSQNDIAGMENISRPQISRLLKRARDIGIVNIQVTLPASTNRQELEHRLEERFGLEKVILAPSCDDPRQNDLSLYFTAANYLGSALGRFKSVGLGWGKTIYNIALNMAPQGEHEDLTFYSTTGISGTNNPYLQTNNITDRFAEKFHAKVCYNNMLTLTLRQSIDETVDARLTQLRQSWDTLDAVVFGVGGQSFSDALYLDEMPPNFYTPWLGKQIVGDILGNFFLIDSSIMQYPPEYELISIGLAALRKNKCSICVAHGETKVKALLITLQEHLAKTLITDENTAKCILRQVI